MCFGLAALSAPGEESAGAEPVTVTDHAQFSTTDQTLFPDRVSDTPVFVQPVFQESRAGSYGRIIEDIPQDVPVEILQAAWDQALATCLDYSYSRQIHFSCSNVTIRPTRSECQTGHIGTRTVSVTCCLSPTDAWSNGCFLNQTVVHSYTVDLDIDVGQGLGPRPTQSAPAPFDVGMVVDYHTAIEATIEAHILWNDGGLVDVNYDTDVTLTTTADEVVAGTPFTVRASHSPRPTSSMTSEYPALGAKLFYAILADSQVDIDYAYMDPNTGQQQRRQETIFNYDTHNLAPSSTDAQGRLIGELAGLRAGLWEGLELRFMDGVPYAPPPLDEYSYKFGIPPLPDGVGLPVRLTWPFSCPDDNVVLLDAPNCILFNPPISINLAELRFQKPSLNTPVGQDFDGGVAGQFDLTPLVPDRSALDPLTGALVSTIPSGFRPALNFDPGGNVSIDDFLGDDTNLSPDYTRFEIDLDGLLALAAGIGTTGLSPFGINIGVPYVFDMELNSLDSDLVLWWSYDQQLRFEPNLVVELGFSQPVQWRSGPGAPWNPPTSSIELAAGVGGFPGEVQILQPPGGVTVTPVYSLRGNRLRNDTWPVFTFAWQNSFLEAKLGGVIGTVLDAAGVLPAGEIAAGKSTLATAPDKGRNVGSNLAAACIDTGEPCSQGHELADFSNVTGQAFTVAEKAPIDTDGDGVFDHLDNCMTAPNPSQFDTDGDGYGNRCDADLNNNGGLVNFADLVLFRAAFGTLNANADFDGSGGLVNFADLAIFRSLFGQLPGPTGVAP